MCSPLHNTAASSADLGAVSRAAPWTVRWIGVDQMSLPPRQAQVLKRIEHSLHACDPHLRSMFAIFAKLTRDEEMPRLEELRSRSSPLRAWRQRLT